MWPCYKFPYSQMRDLNLDWVIEKIKDLEDAIKHLEVPEEYKEELDALRKTVTDLSKVVAEHEVRINELEKTKGVYYELQSAEVSAFTTPVVNFTETLPNATRSGNFIPFDL